MAQQIRVFVSHHHSPEEDAFTARLAADLTAAGADVWWDTGRIASGNFVRQINEGLAGRQWLVLVMTPASLGSRWVQEEVDAALHQVHGGRMLGVIPIVAQPCDEGSIPALWATLHRYDATRAYQPARDGLLRALGLNVPAAPAAPTAPQPSESADDLLERGKALTAQERYAEALPLLERAAQRDPSSFDAWANLGYLLGEMGQWNESLTTYDRALTLNANQAWVWTNKGRALIALNRYEKALAALDQTLALDPNNAIAWNNKGLALHGLKRYAEAQAAYDRAKELV